MIKTTISYPLLSQPLTVTVCHERGYFNSEIQEFLCRRFHDTSAKQLVGTNMACGIRGGTTWIYEANLPDHD